MEEYVQQALEIVKAQASVRNMDENEMTSMIENLSKELKTIVEGGASGGEGEAPQEPAVDPKKAVREKSVVCLECGKKFKVLTKKHLATHDLTPEEYKEKWGFKKNAPLIAKDLARQRKKKMNEMQLWKKRSKVAAQE